MPFEEISLRPELSSPPHFRIQGGYPERDTVGAAVVAGLYFSFIILVFIISIFQPTAFNNMNHELVYTILGWFVFITNTGYFVAKAFLDPISLNSNLRAFLMDEDDWEERRPAPGIFLPILGSSIFFLFSTVVMKTWKLWKTWTTAPSTIAGKFKNPLRNLNVIIVMVILVFTVLQLSPHQGPAGLLFPRFTLG